MPKSAVKQRHDERSCGGLISRLAYHRAGHQGVNLDRVLQQAGLRPADIANPQARLSVTGQVKFVEGLADALADPELGFHLAEEFDLRRLEFLYYVAASADTLGTALQRLERYCGLVNEGLLVLVKKGKTVRIRFEHAGVARHTDQQQIEFFITAAIRLCRHLVNREIKPLRLRLAHHRKVAKDGLAKLAGVRIETNAAVNEVEFPASIWTLRIATTDDHLHDLLVRYCEDALARRMTTGSPLRARVENAAADLLPHGQAQAGIVAAKLGMSSRTLARRLSQDELSFASIIRDLRLALAQRYLADRGLPISQIAWLLGYREIGAFTHAFRRWTGITPTEARETRSAVGQ